VRLLDAGTLRPKAEHRLEYQVTGLTYSRDGKLLFLRGQAISWRESIPPLVREEVGWLDPASGACPEKPEVEWEGKNTLVCSGDGRAMAWMTQEEGAVKVQPLFPQKGASRPVQVQVKERVGKGLALATERGPLAFSDAENRIRVIELRTLKELACLGGHEQPVLALLLTADGRRLISAAGDDFGKPLEVIVWNVPGQLVHKRLPGLSGPFNRFFLSEDGRYLAVGVRAVNESTDLTVWDVERGEKIHTSTYLAYGTPAAFSPDGRRLAVVGYSGEVRILDLPHRE
jgi:WD40 repeat protein